jgi:hypothetical protein
MVDVEKKKKLIENWLDVIGIKHYYISKELVVSVNNSVDISGVQIKKLPFQFGKVKGNFLCRGCGLDVMWGFPHTVTNNFDCSYNNIKHLDGFPSNIKGYVNISHNSIKSLDTNIRRINYYYKDFDCSYNKLTNLFGGPFAVAGNYICTHNELKTLSMHPNYVGGLFVSDDIKGVKIPENIFQK